MVFYIVNGLNIRGIGPSVLFYDTIFPYETYKGKIL
jgi:hypothetical protein